MEKTIINKNILHPDLAYENALLCYVYGRVTMNTDWFLFLLPSVFYFFHYAVEISLKRFLSLNGIEYPSSGQKGHKTEELFKLLIENKLDSKSVGIFNLSKNLELLGLLKYMDDNYQNNKYDYPGYNLQGITLVKLIDEIIYVLFEEINFIYKSNNHVLAKLNVPESVEKMFLNKLEKPFSYTIINFQEDNPI